jgi:hypothetical protein
MDESLELLKEISSHMKEHTELMKNMVTKTDFEAGMKMLYELYQDVSDNLEVHEGILGKHEVRIKLLNKKLRTKFK